MAPFCTSPLWDWNYTWYSKYPRLTSCFESTVLTYTPAILLMPFGLLQLLVQRRKEQSLYRQPFSWTPLSLSRFIASVLLTFTYALSLMYKLTLGESSGSSVTADLVYCVTFAIAMQVQEKDRKNGIGSSMLLFCFWSVTTVCKLPECLRHMTEAFTSDTNLSNFYKLELAVWASSYPIILFQLFLSCWTDARQDEKRPYLTAPPVSFLLFGWLTDLILKRSQRSLQLEDLYSVPQDMMTRQSHSKWNTIWMKELHSAGYVPEVGSCVVTGTLTLLLRSLWKVYWKPVVISCILATLRVVLKIIPALLLHLLMGYMSGSDPTWKGILYAIGIVSANFGSRLLGVHIEKTLTFTGLNMKTVMVAAIYRKMLRLSSESQREYTIGELVNLISVDADQILKLSISFGFVASGAPLIVVAVIILWQFIGGACLAGVAVMLVILPLTALVVSTGNKYQKDQMGLKDKRLNFVAEILSSMKVLKLFAWENIFTNKCTSLRLAEMVLLKKYSYMTALNFFLFGCSASMVALASFVTFVLISDSHILDPSTAFVSLTLFDCMQYPMFLIPAFISNVVQTRVSIMRIQRFLLSSEVKECSVGRQLKEGDAVSVKNGTFSWFSHKTPVLNNINVTVKTGQLIAVVGPVGSGKSSLLSAILGNLRIFSGSVDRAESVAYSPQCPWIQNKTLRENVLFGSLFDAELYDMVLKACCLERDLEILPGGDTTEIGERGINLSGGQKQRVSLARVAYQRRELYLFDDPLSAVDAHVGASIFNNLIGPRGMLKETTRILVTHNLSVLTEVDYIIVMQNGSVVETGTFQDLKHQGSILSKLLRNVSKRVHKFAAHEDSSVKTSHVPDIEQGPRKSNLVEEETVEEGSVSLQVYGTYIRHAGPLFLFVILCYAGYIAIGLFVGIWLSEWVNDSLFSVQIQDLSLRIYRIWVYVILVVFKAVVNFFAISTLWKVALSSSTRLHQLMLYGVMRTSLSFLDVTPSGRILNRFGKDVDQLDVQLPTTAHFFLNFLFLFVSSIILVCIHIPIYLLIVIPVLACLLVLLQKYAVQFRQVKRLETVTRSPVNNHFSETLAGLSSIRSFGVQGVFLRDNDDKIDTMQTCTVNGFNFEYWAEVWMEVANEMLLFLMLLLLVTSRDMISTGRAGLLVSYTNNALNLFTSFIFYSNELEATLLSAERLDEYARLTPEEPWTSTLKPDPHWPASGAVSFKSYSTRYRDGLSLALRDVNVDISPGEKLGIVGRTGAGKSTITLSLFRIIEAASGKIVVDGIDISALRLHDLRSRITILPQEPVLFQGTLRFNLDPAGQHDTAELWWALDRSHLGDFFRTTYGLDFEVTEGGLNLSVGQRQLVCLARAVLRKTKILVLDEATASVDMNTDLLVQQTLRDAMSGCTVLTIAHRLQTVLSSDRVIVIDQGRVVEVGSPAELLTDITSSFYAMALEAGVVFDGVKA
ncbi:multidrug resistance-associated protein 1-like [Ixodes scapularis]|uniref:multidrug resistance-associated protein 1-like n=1 Tax=Ixodes scapularis TaxID=6945 RepID=UPI001C393520|nr:multidrug resistance-associated protein 1-like [Ixodes scapularis]